LETEDRSSTGSGKLVFNLVRSPEYRTLFVDGAIGAVLPTGMLSVVLYQESYSLPSRIEHEILPEGNLVQEAPTTPSVSIERELQARLVLTADAAQALVTWLQERIHESQQLAVARAAAYRQAGGGEGQEE